ncbi:hypothetical protein SCALM49S_05109 [Streptomyces californicus]
MLRQVTPGRYDSYEALLAALADGRIWMLLWNDRPVRRTPSTATWRSTAWGTPPASPPPRSSPPAAGTAPTNWSPAVTSPAPCSPTTGVSGSTRTLPAAASASPGSTSGASPRDWTGCPAGPLRLSDPAIELPQFYALLSQNAHRTPAVRSLRRAWVHPAVGVPYLAIGLDLYDTGRDAVESVRAMMRQSVAAVPEGLPVSTVALSDEYDPVGMWLRANARPFYDREAHRRPSAPRRSRLRIPAPAPLTRRSRPAVRQHRPSPAAPSVRQPRAPPLVTLRPTPLHVRLVNFPREDVPDLDGLLTVPGLD